MAAPTAAISATVFPANILTMNTTSSLFTETATTPTMEPAVNLSASEDLYNPFESMPLDSNFAWLLCALSCVFLWMIYGSCFHSRVIGYVVGSLLNQYFKRNGLGELRIGETFQPNINGLIE